MKPTTDGRYVHLCCAFWSKQSTIVDLSEMSPINVTDVPVQYPEEEDMMNVLTSTFSTLSSTLSVSLTNSSNHYSKSKSNSNSFNSISASSSSSINNVTSALQQKYEEFCRYFKESNIHDVCSICESKGGYVVQCAGCNNCINDKDNNSTPCHLVCHPICAWFRGWFVDTILVDPTFQSKDRNGIFPAGMDYNFYCFDHTPKSQIDLIRNSQNSSQNLSQTNSQMDSYTMEDIRNDQRLLRVLYSP